MTRVALYVLSFLILIGTIPWFFSQLSASSIAGFPAWAFYSLTATACYGLIIALLLKKYWHLSSGEKEPRE